MATNDEKTPAERLAEAVRECYDAGAKATAKAHAIVRDCPDAVTREAVALAIPKLQTAMLDLNEALAQSMEYAAIKAREAVELAAVTVEGPQPGNDDPAYSLQDEDLGETPEPGQWRQLTTAQIRGLADGEYIFIARRERLTYPVPTIISDGSEERVAISHYISRPRKGRAQERVSVTLLSTDWAEYDDSEMFVSADGTFGAEDYGMRLFAPFGQGRTLDEVQAEYREVYGEGRRGER